MGGRGANGLRGCGRPGRSVAGLPRAGIAWLGTTAGHEALDESSRLATAVGSADRVSFSRMWCNFSIQRLGYTAERELNLRIALRAAAADGLGSSMEAALRYMLAEYLTEIGCWDEAAAELELNLQRVMVSGIPFLFSWGYQARLVAWRGDSAAAENALQRTRSLTELAPQQPLPLSSALVGWADWLLWEGQLDAAVAAARKRLPSGRSAGTTPQSRLPSCAGPKPTSPNAPAGKAADRNLVSASISLIGWATSSASRHPAPSPSPPPATPSCPDGRGSGIRCPGTRHFRRGRRRVTRTGRHVPAGGWPGRMSSTARDEPRQRHTWPGRPMWRPG